MKNKYYIYRISMGILLSIVLCLHCFSAPPIHPGINAASLPPTIENTTICNNQLPYLWNGINCLTAGTYSATLTGSNGADSIVVLNLSVINVGTSITNAIICDNELPYHWNGNVYTTNGTYSVTLTSSSGCDSVPILSLTVNHNVTSTTNRTICSNELPYNWNGNNYPAAGTYSVTLTSSAGCDSIATLNLAVNPVSSSTTSITVCVNQLPYNWNGNSYPAAGTYAIILPGSNGCDSTAILNLSASTTTSSNTTVIVCINQLPYNWNGNNYIAAGNYSVNLMGSSGCDSIASLTLLVAPVLASNTNVFICTGQLPYTWNGNAYNTAGNYQVTLTSSFGCDSIPRLHLVVFNFLTSTTNESICDSELPYTWNGNTYNTGGTYTASFITPAGCDSIATLNLTVNSPHSTSDSVVVCENDLPYDYHGHIITAAGNYEIVPPFPLNSCISIDSLNVVIQPIIPSNTPVIVCNNSLPYTWNGNAYNATGIYTISLTSTAGCDSTAILDLTVNDTTASVINLTICSDQVPYLWNGTLYDTTGIYTATLTSSAGCDSIVTLDLIVNSVYDTAVDLTICTAQTPYTWNGNNYNSTGIYTVTLASSGGCDSIVTLNLAVQNFLSSTTDINVCDNLLPYNWNGNSYPGAGVYSVNLISVVGCDSIATLNLVVNPVITSTTDISICTTQLPYSWNGNSYPAGGIYSVTLITSGGCDSVATLNLVVNNTVTSTTDLTICNNQLPFSWNGNSYPQAGTYPVILTSSAGCDSIAILNLSVTDILTSTTNVNICPALLPYIWNGNSYPAGGTYSVTIVNANGCDSVPILSLTVVPYVTSTTDTQICNNQLPYTWNGNVYAAAGTYSVLLVGSVCDSLVTLNLSVYPPITSNTSISICQQQFPYSWNGNSYDVPGTYSLTFTSTSGCDSIATLILDELPVTTSTTDITVCANQLPYSWNGNSYSTGGSYTVTLTGTNNCDSIATLNLTANFIDTSISNINICNNQLPYTWNGNNYAAGGLYYITLTGNSGCDSVATLNLSATPVVTSLSNVNVCDNHLPYNWNGIDYSIPGTYSATFTSSSGCDSIATLNLTINSVVTSNTNANTCSNQLPYSWNGQNYSTAGAHIVTLTSAAGCDSIATLNLTINPVASSNTIASTCSNQLPYNWNGQSYSTAGSYSVTLNTTTGCDSIANLQLTIFSVTASNTNYSTCSAQLPYTWNGQNYTTTGIYTATLTSSNGCDSVATLNFTVNLTPPLPAVTSPIAYCQYEATAPLVANATIPGAHLLWYTNATGGTGAAATPTPSSATAGTFSYYVSQVDGPCEGPRALITITINSKPDLGPDKPLKICYGQSADLSSLYNVTGYTSNWTYNEQPIADSTAVTTEGSYQLIAVNSFGCADTALVNLDIQAPVIANAGNDANIEYNFPYQLSGSGGGSYQWSPPGLLNNAFIANPTTVLTDSATFVLMVSDEIGCFDLDTVKLKVLNGPTFYVPTAFTPNGDGVNDYFKPTPVGIAKLEFFRVFNRYGELVFETSEIGKGWDGIYKGVKQPSANFVWSLKGVDRKGETKIMKGNAILIR